MSALSFHIPMVRPPPPNPNPIQIQIHNHDKPTNSLTHSLTHSLTSPTGRTRLLGRTLRRLLSLPQNHPVRLLVFFPSPPSHEDEITTDPHPRTSEPTIKPLSTVQTASSKASSSKSSSSSSSSSSSRPSIRSRTSAMWQDGLGRVFEGRRRKSSGEE
jgi:hypothetical protein